MEQKLIWFLCSFVLALMVVSVISILRLNRIQKQNLALKLAFEEHQEALECKVQERTLTLDIALKELESANQELARKNQIDTLTGLNNRTSYDERIHAEFRRSKRSLSPLSLVIIDIDHFKAVNDTYGHLAGDKCLLWLAQTIQKTIRRESDTAFRYGGEEFCIILPVTDAKGAFILSEALRKAIENEAFHFENQVINITISCGIFTYIQQETFEPEKIFSAADKALYHAKNTGRNKTVMHSQEEAIADLPTK